MPTRDGKDFSRERGNLTNVQTRRTTGYSTRAVDVSGKRGEVTVAVRKGKAGSKVAGGKQVAKIRGHPRKVNKAVAGVVANAGRPDLKRAALARATALGRVSESRRVKSRGARVPLKKRISKQKTAKARASAAK